MRILLCKFLSVGVLELEVRGSEKGDSLSSYIGNWRLPRDKFWIGKLIHVRFSSLTLFRAENGPWVRSCIEKKWLIFSMYRNISKIPLKSYQWLLCDIRKYTFQKFRMCTPTLFDKVITFNLFRWTIFFSSIFLTGERTPFAVYHIHY